MDVRQRLDDLRLLLAHDRKAQVIAGLLVVAIIWLAVGGAAPRQRMTREPITVHTGAGDPKEAIDDVMIRFDGEVEEIRQFARDAAERNQQLAESQRESEERVADILKTLIERLADLERSQAVSMERMQAPLDVEGELIGTLPVDDLGVFGDLDEPPPPLPPPPPPRRLALIGAGDSVRIKLLAGVNAPTDGTPYPVVFELIDDVHGPDASSLPLGGARLIAAAQGSLTDTRALFRLSSLNMSFPDGSRKVFGVDGWVVGEDGIRGMEGLLVDPLGKVLAGTLAAGTVAGVGEGLAGANQTFRYNSDGSVTRLVDGELWQYGLGKGMSSSANKWTDIVEGRMRLMVPHVKVFSGREATAVFSRSITIDGLYDAYDGDDFYPAMSDW